MNPRVLRRFIIICIVMSLAVPVVALGFHYFSPPPGDYETRQGDIHLTTAYSQANQGNETMAAREYQSALEAFDRALEAHPNHRGALMGRALVFIQTERYEEAIAQLRDLIAFLNETLEDDDLTGRGALAAAHANLGIVFDRMGRYEQALEHYMQAITIDDETVSGPALVDRIIHQPHPATVRDRAVYIATQLELPEEERRLRIPEQDAEQRMYRP
ncbi:MAG: tetratricopeptide repeat protein [Alphaproteobacteria bacterium]|jgi:tetratricopeptide (TPR) repeat protein|nr:tetratricopeptide repeat protein [Alphaproteobacteria bacterium]